MTKKEQLEFFKEQRNEILRILHSEEIDVSDWKISRKTKGVFTVNNFNETKFAKRLHELNFDLFYQRKTIGKKKLAIVIESFSTNHPVYYADIHETDLNDWDWMADSKHPYSVEYKEFFTSLVELTAKNDKSVAKLIEKYIKSS